MQRPRDAPPPDDRDDPWRRPPAPPGVPPGREPDSDDDERAALRRARHDPAAFAPIYDHYHDRIYGFCLRRLRDREAAADATAQTFARALAGLASYRDGSVAGWLFAVARNVVIDAVRRDRPALDLAAAGAVPDRDAPPDQQAIDRERRARLLDAIARLTPEQRGVVELRLAGLAGQEVADALGMTLGAVRSSQFRAFRALRRTLTADPLFDTFPASPSPGDTP